MKLKRQTTTLVPKNDTGPGMANLEKLEREDLPHLEKVLASSETAMGFVPNSMLTMSHMPQLTMAFSILAGTVFGADLKALLNAYADSVPDDPRREEALSPDLIQLIAFATSTAAGCRYCQAHTSHNAHRSGVSEDKLADLLNYETSEHFSAAEKALVALALAAGAVPNESTAAHFDRLKAHFSQRQISQIVATISLFGFLNRWNDTMATELEEIPRGFAERELAAGGWQVGKHAS